VEASLSTEDRGGHHVSTEENKEKVRRYVEEVLNGKNLEAVNDIFASDCVLQDPNLSEERQGSEVIAAFARLCHIVSPDFTVHVEEMVAEGDTVMIGWTASHNADEAKVLGLSMFRFDNEGKVFSMRQVYRSLEDIPTTLVSPYRINDDIVAPLGDEHSLVGCWIHPRPCK